MTKWIVVLAALALATGVKSAAAAEPFPPELQAEYHDALAKWGVSALPQCRTVSLVIVAFEELNVGGGNAIARASQAAPGQVLDECVLVIDREVAFVATPCERQVVIAHEVGHLLGYNHSDNPQSIMYPDANGFCSEELAAEESQAVLRAGLQKEVRRCRQKPARQRHVWCTPRVRFKRHVLQIALSEPVPPPLFP